MYRDTSIVRSAKGVAYSRTLLRTSFRVDGKVRHRTLGNLSDCSEQEIHAIRLALKHKEQLAALLTPQASTASPPVMKARSPDTPAASPPAEDTPSFTQGPSVGAIAVLRGLAEYPGIVGALGDDREGRLALWQVIARALDQGSRLSAVRLARDLGAESILGLPSFDEDDLYNSFARWRTMVSGRTASSLARNVPAEIHCFGAAMRRFVFARPSASTPNKFPTPHRDDRPLKFQTVNAPSGTGTPVPRSCHAHTLVAEQLGGRPSVKAGGRDRAFNKKLHARRERRIASLTITHRRLDTVRDDGRASDLGGGKLPAQQTAKQQESTKCFDWF